MYTKPNTVEEAFEFISTINVPKRGDRPVFVTQAKYHGGRSKSTRGRGHERTESRSGRGREHNAQAGERGNRGRERVGPSEDRPCLRCGSPLHWISDCPERVDETENAKASNDRSSVAHQKKILLVLPNDILDRQDMATVQLDRDGGPPPEKSTRALVGGSVMAAYGKLPKHAVVIDSGGSVNIINNLDMATDEPYEVEESVCIGGAVIDGGEIVSNTMVDTVFGPAYYSTDCAACILAYSHLKDYSFECYQNKDDDVFRVRMTEQGDTFVFERKHGIYVLSSRYERALVTTVEENKKRFTKDEVKRAEEADELIRRLGYPSEEAVAKQLNRGGIINCKLTSRDIKNRREIYGPPVGSLKEKTTNHKSGGEHISEPVIGTQEHEEQRSYIDIMYVNSIMFLVNVIMPIGMTLADIITKRSTDALYKTLYKQLSTINSRGFKVKKVTCDPESGLTAMRDALGTENGIHMEVAGQNEHVPVVERKIRTIKERVRGIYNTLPYKLPTKLLGLLALFCISHVNMIPSTSSPTGASPWERFYGRKLDYSKNLKESFGDYCQAHDNKSDNTLKTRTTSALTVYDTGNLDGTWYLYNLNTDKLIKRNRFQILPMPDVVINYLNNMKEAKDISEEINFRVGFGNERDFNDVEDREETVENEHFMDDVARRYIQIRSTSQTYDPIITDNNMPCIEEEDIDDGEATENMELDKSDKVADEEKERKSDSDNDTGPMNSNDDSSDKCDDTAPEYIPRREGLRTQRKKPGSYTRREYGLHLTPRQAISQLGAVHDDRD